MHHKIKNTLAGFTVALSMLSLGYSFGRPPSANALAQIDLSAPSLEAQSNIQPIARKRSQGIKRHLSMPYFSFGPLLPRRGS